MNKEQATVSISNGELLRVLFERTIYDKWFRCDEWSIEQGRDLIKAGEMIIREIEDDYYNNHGIK